MSKKATHKGSCQCCGSVQKLPGGVLSNHGYRVLWNSFHGVCPGASHLPYEQSCELIEQFVRSATKQMNNLIEFRAALLAPATGNKAWIHEYISGGWSEKSRHVWREVELFMVDGDSSIYFVDAKGKTVSAFRQGYYDRTIPKLVEHLNEVKARDVASDIKKLQEYIHWQNKRIADWKLTALMSI